MSSSFCTEFLSTMYHTFIKYAVLSLFLLVYARTCTKYTDCIYKWSQITESFEHCHKTLWAHFSQCIAQFNTLPPPHYTLGIMYACDNLAG